MATVPRTLYERKFMTSLFPGFHAKSSAQFITASKRKTIHNNFFITVFLLLFLSKKLIIVFFVVFFCFITFLFQSSKFMKQKIIKFWIRTFWWKALNYSFMDERIFQTVYFYIGMAYNDEYFYKQATPSFS